MDISKEQVIKPVNNKGFLGPVYNKRQRQRRVNTAIIENNGNT